MRFQRRKLAIGIVIGILIIIVTCLPRSAPPDPIYNDKTLSAWVWRYDSYRQVINNGIGGPRPDTDEMIEAAEVLNQNRTNVIPILLRKVATRTPSFQRLADKLFFSQWAFRVGLAKGWQERHPGIQREIGMLGFRMLGTNAAYAAPDLIRIMDTTPDPECRLTARRALGYVDPANPALK